LITQGARGVPGRAGSEAAAAGYGRDRPGAGGLVIDIIGIIGIFER
jgi:hypothetical protein